VLSCLATATAITITITVFPGPCLGGPPPLPDQRLGIRTAPLLLLSRLDVRTEIGLDEAQTADAEKTLTKLYGQAATLKGKTGPEVLAGRRAIDEAAEDWIKTRLSPAQRKRLIEIDLQWEGPSALVRRPVVADHLGLTAEQRAQLTRAIAERDRRRAQGGDWRASEHQLAQQALAVLTPEQRERWRAMLGRHFTPQLAGTRAAPPR
jgi:hypothetical protein